MFSKNKKFIYALSSFLAVFNANSFFAEPNFDIIGTQKVDIKTSALLPNGSPVMKTISLFSILPKESSRFNKENFKLWSFEKDYSKGIIPFSQSPGAVDLGMNDVPVLDQSHEGTCAIFTLTGALDALLGVGDFISQQCTIELNLALGRNEWHGGSPIRDTLESIKQYGIVEHKDCNAEYPDLNAGISIYDYMSRASKTVNLNSVDYNYNPISVNLYDLKRALNSGHRILIVFAMRYGQDLVAINGFDITINGKTMPGGLWACQQPNSNINNCGPQNVIVSGIVIGYDDAQELLKIRNSWGDLVGDKGDYYMTYRYFEAMHSYSVELYKGKEF